MSRLADCSCAEPPTFERGSAGWNPDCPIHSVDALLRAPPTLDLSTLRERVDAMLAEIDATACPECGEVADEYEAGICAACGYRGPERAV